MNFISLQVILQLLISSFAILDVKCDKNVNLFLDEYFRQQRTIKVFTQFSNDTDWNKNSIVRTLFEKKKVLIYNYTEIQDLQSTFFPDFGYFTVTSVIDNNFLDQLSNIRNNGRWLIFLEQNSDEFNDEVLKITWDKYRILHIVILMYDRINQMFTVSFYNPFVIVSATSRGVFNRMLVKDSESIKLIVQKIDARGRNLHKYELKTYLEAPAVTYANPVYDHKGKLWRFKGIDGEVLEAIRHSMNFNIQFMTEFPDTAAIKSLSKRISDLVDKRMIDLIADGRFLNKSGIDNSFPLTPLTSTYIVCALPAKRLNQLINPFFGFLDVPASILFNASTILIVISLYFSMRIKNSLSRYFLDVIGIQYNISRSLQIYDRIASRIVLLSLFVLNVTIMSTFQANIISRLNVVSKAKQMNTLNDLVRENVTILTLSPFYYLLETDTRDSTSVHDKLFHQLSYNDAFTNPVMFRKMSSGEVSANTGTLVRQYQALYLQAQYSNGGNIHVVREPVAVYPMTIHLPGWSPFISIINEMLLRVFEMGFFQKGYNDADQLIWMEQMKAYKNQEKYEMNPAPIAWEHLSLAFLMYMIMLGVAFIVFLLEIIYHKFCSNYKKT